MLVHICPGNVLFFVELFFDIGIVNQVDPCVESNPTKNLPGTILHDKEPC